MKLEVDRNSLLEGLIKIQNAVSTQSTLPILSNVLLETIEDGLTIIGTDLDIGVISKILVKVSATGSITVPARRFLDIIKELPESMVMMSARKNNMLQIICESAQFKIMGIPKDDFPKLPEFKDKDSIKVDQGLVRAMLNMTSFAMSRDETRYVLNGVYVIFKNDILRMVATDGRRLALIDREIEFGKEIDVKIIIPVKAVLELQRNLKEEGELSILFGGNQVMFDLGDSKIISRLIEGEFPNYEHVIPKEMKEKVVVDREKFLLAAKRAGLFTSQDSQAIRLDIEKNKMVITKDSPDIGEAREEIEVNYGGSPISIGFNPNYIIDVLKNLSEQSIGFELQDPEKPGVIRTKDRYVYVLLPMQLA